VPRLEDLSWKVQASKRKKQDLHSSKVRTQGNENVPSDVNFAERVVEMRPNSLKKRQAALLRESRSGGKTDAEFTVPKGDDGNITIKKKEGYGGPEKTWQELEKTPLVLWESGHPFQEDPGIETGKRGERDDGKRRGETRLELSSAFLLNVSFYCGGGSIM